LCSNSAVALYRSKREEPGATITEHTGASFAFYHIGIHKDQRDSLNWLQLDVDVGQKNGTLAAYWYYVTSFEHNIGYSDKKFYIYLSISVFEIVL